MKKTHFLSLLFLTILISAIECKKNHEKAPIDVKPVSEAHLGDTIKVNFPAGSVTATSTVILKTVTDPTIKALFEEDAPLYDVEHALPYAILLDIGQTQAVTDSISIEIKLPDYFKNLKASSSGFELFAQIYQQGGEESLDDFVLVSSAYSISKGSLVAKLPRLFFTNNRNPAKTFEAVLMVGITPGPNNVISALNRNVKIFDVSTDCEAGPIVCPLGSLDICSDLISKAKPDELFGDRINPITHQPEFHKGVDFKVPEGTKIYSAGDGVVIQSQLSATAGNFILIKHSTNIKTRYLHLSSRLVKVGDKISTGQLIGLSGKTGLATGPHLHFELYPNPLQNATKKVVNPVYCIQEQNTSGSIKIDDNGTLADDAFEIFLDGTSIGSTKIGGANSIALDNLRPGIKTLTVNCLVAPDNVGTYEVILNDGITFANDGGVYQTGELEQGASISWQIIVPAKATKTNNSILSRRNSAPEKRKQ